MSVDTTELLDADGFVVPLHSRGGSAASGKKRAPTPFKPAPWVARRSIHLRTLDEVRVEMSRIYRAMSNGTIATNDGSRLVYTLTAIAKVIEVSQFEQRLTRLELAAQQPALTFDNSSDNDEHGSDDEPDATP